MSVTDGGTQMPSRATTAAAEVLSQASRAAAADEPTTGRPSSSSTCSSEPSSPPAPCRTGQTTSGRRSASTRDQVPPASTAAGLDPGLVQRGDDAAPGGQGHLALGRQAAGEDEDVEVRRSRRCPTRGTVGVAGSGAVAGAEGAAEGPPQLLLGGDDGGEAADALDQALRRGEAEREADVVADPRPSAWKAVPGT